MKVACLLKARDRISNSIIKEVIMKDWANDIRVLRENRQMNFHEESLAPLHWAVYLIAGFGILILLLTGALG
jgi:hypothetical protein